MGSKHEAHFQLITKVCHMGTLKETFTQKTAVCHLRSQDCTTAALPVPVFLVKPVAYLLLFISKQTYTM